MLYYMISFFLIKWLERLKQMLFFCAKWTKHGMLAKKIYQKACNYYQKLLLNCVY